MGEVLNLYRGVTEKEKGKNEQPAGPQSELNREWRGEKEGPL